MILNLIKTINYKNINTALEELEIDVLYPTKLPLDTSLKQLLVYQENKKQKVAYIFNDTQLMYSVTINEKISKEVKLLATEKLKIKDKDCYLFEMNDICVIQIQFEYNGNLYMMSYNNKQDLVEVIENLKELE